MPPAPSAAAAAAAAATQASKMTPVNSGRMLLPQVVSGLRILGLVLPVASLALMVYLLAKTFVSTQGVRSLHRLGQIMLRLS